MKHLILLTFTVVFAAQSVFAVPACPTPVKKIQSDGTVITVRLKGDEKVHWMESLDGYTLMYDSKQDVVFAETDADGDLQPSKILYRGQDLKPYSAYERQKISQLSKYHGYSKRQVQLLKQIWKMASDTESSVLASSPEKAVSPVITPVLGEKKVLCILADFSDRAMVKSKTEFEQLMNQAGYTANGNSGSVKDFYRANSFGKMDITVSVVGPVTLPNTTAYYATAPGEYDFPKKVAELASSLVDYSQFAIDGYVPTFHILFAGYGDEAVQDEQQIWSHAWQFVREANGRLYSDLKKYNNVWVGRRYSCSPELSGSSGSSLTAIGVVCHELCHTFGSPDYYDTDDDESGGDFQGMGYWDLMASGSWNNGGRTPAQINIYQKILYGWVNPVELTTPTTVTDMPNSVDSAMAYTISTVGDGEMYILENRQNKGFDLHLPGSGLLIYHIHASAVTGRASNKAHPQQCYVVAASSTEPIPTGTVSSYGSINSARTPFPGTSRKTSFTSVSTPRMFTWSNNSPIDKPITEITANTTKKTVSFKFMGGAPNYAIKLNHSGIYEFEKVIHGYETPTACSITISNVGAQPTGILNIALSGADSSKFILSKQSVSNIAVGQDSSFTIVPKNGLPVGIYSATVTVSGNNGLSEIFNLNFIVDKAKGAILGIPTLAYRTHDSIAVNAFIVPNHNQQAQYAIHTISNVAAASLTWQYDTVFGNLMPEEAYFVYMRSAENENYHAGTMSVSKALVTLETPVYSIALTQNATYVFDSISQGYAAQKPYAVTIVNNGNRSIQLLAIALSGKNPDCFTLSNTAVTDLPPNAESPFTIVPNTGLSAGTYTAVVTVSDNHTISKNFQMSFTVSKATSKLRDLENSSENISLQTWIANGILYVKGLETNQKWYLYAISGTLIEQGVATTDPLEIPLKASLPHGTYMFRSGHQSVKIVY